MRLKAVALAAGALAAGSLASGATALVGAAVGGWWLRDWLPPLDAAERVIDFPRGDSAELAGFGIARELTERAIRGFPGGAVTAMRYLTPDQGTLYKRLTPRQLEILQLIASGHSTAVIAQRLCLSPETVRWHVKSILRKLRAKNRAEAAATLREIAV